MHSSPPALTGYLLAFFTLLVWSGFVIASRHAGTGVLTPYDLAALRIGTAALVLLPWWLPLLWRPRQRGIPAARAWPLALVVGIAYPLLAYGGLSLAPASHGGVLLSGMLPFFAALVAGLWLGERPGGARLLGLALILAGVITLFVANLAGFGIEPDVLPGDLMLLGASLSWAIFTVAIRHWGMKAFEVMLTVTALAALLYLPTYLLWLPKQLQAASLQDILLQALFQGVLVVCVAMWTYAKATEILGAQKVVIIMSTVPMLATLLAVPLLDEALTAAAATGAALTGLGALIGALARPSTRR